MGEIVDQSLTFHSRINYRKKENHHHNKRNSEEILPKFDATLVMIRDTTPEISP